MTRANEILNMINNEEGIEVEFKESLQGLESEDLVAFANSEKGGTILIGVKEQRDQQGRQKGVVVGCRISDQGRLTVLNKANSCRPPVNVEISSELIESKEIYIIDIPTGSFKPYCTSKGTYTIRGDGQNRALYSNELLSLFMETEKEKFISSFREVARGLEESIIQTKKVLVTETNKLLTTFKDFEGTVEQNLANISSSAENAEDYSNTIESTVSNIEDTVDEVWDILIATLHLLPKIDSKTNLSPNHDYVINYAKETLSRFIYRVQRKDAISERAVSNQIKIIRRMFPELTETQLKHIFEELLNEHK